MSKALLVIDMQEATIGANHAKMFNYSQDLLSKINEAIKNTDANAVIYIRNLMKKTLLNKMAPVKCFDGTKEAGYKVTLRTELIGTVFEKQKEKYYGKLEMGA